MTSQNKILRWKVSIAYSIAGANGPNGVIFNSNDGVFFCTDAMGGLLLLLLRSRRMSATLRCGPLVHDVVAPIDVKRFAGNESRCVMRQESGSHSHVINTDEAAGRGLRLRLVEQRIKFRDAGGRPRRKRARRDRVHTNSLWPEFCSKITHCAFERCFRNAHNIVVLNHHLTAVV